MPEEVEETDFACLLRCDLQTVVPTVPDRLFYRSPPPVRQAYQVRVERGSRNLCQDVGFRLVDEPVEESQDRGKDRQDKRTLVDEEEVVDVRSVVRFDDEERFDLSV